MIPGNEVINVKEKFPTISIRGVEDYQDEADLIKRMKVQNEHIKEKLEGGSHFSVVFSKEHNESNEFQVVARVSDDLRAVMKANGDKIFLGFKSLRVTDRFYVKSCSQCHKYGHYRADCTSSPSCGYCCSQEHESANCPVHAAKDHAKYKCTNCEEHNKPSDGHSSRWHKCPTFVEIQKKMMQNIPYYAKNVKTSDRQTDTQA